MLARAGLIAAAAAIAVVAIGTPGSSGARAPAPPSCTLSAGVLTLDPKLWDLTIRREGGAIVPRYTSPVRCEGGAPNVHNVDIVHLLDDEVRLDFRGGAFAPGLTDEGDGSSEIEFEVEHGIGGALELRFGAAADSVTAGNSGPELDAFNLNAAEGVPDVDLLLRPQEAGYGRARVTVSLGGGPDRFAAQIGEALARNDLLVVGENGADEIATGSGDDTAAGQRGRDRIATGGGNDFVDAHDGYRDRVNCGRAVDIVTAERTDRVHRCQRFGSATDAQLAVLFD